MGIQIQRGDTRILVPEVFADGVTMPAMLGEVMRWTLTTQVTVGGQITTVPVCDVVMPIGAFKKALGDIAGQWLSIMEPPWKN